MILRRKDRNSIQISDSELVVLAKKDVKYFGQLYNKYFDRIFYFTFKRIGGNEDAAGDLTQQTFLKALANIGKYEDRGLPFSSWLYKIAQNEINAFFKSGSKTIVVDIEERNVQDLCDEGNIEGISSIEDQEKLIELLNGMKSEELDLIELRFFQGMSFKEIADIYAITEANAKMRVYRILERLNKKWKELK